MTDLLVGLGGAFGVDPGAAFSLGLGDARALEEELQRSEDPPLECGDCGRETHSNDCWIDARTEDPVCDDCAIACDLCEEYGLERSLISRRSYRLCVGCADHCFVCDECGGLRSFFSDDYSTFGDSVYCGHCASRLLADCGDCGETEWVEDVCSDCGVCERCEHSEYCPELSGGANAVGRLHPYDYSPDLSFFGHGPLFVGVELELEVNGDEMERRPVVQYLHGKLGERAYFKHDGSLRNGVEIVTHPMSPAAFANWGHLDQALEALPGMGCLSWNVHRCGFHVHVSRAAFSSARHVFAFALFFYRNREQILSISGRREDDLDRWASLSAHQGEPVVPWGGPRLLDKVRGVNPGPRYSGVNMCNDRTLEVRVFRGSLKPETVRAYVALVVAVFEYSAGLSSAAIRSGALDWSAFRSSLNSSEHRLLLDLCDRRGV